MSDERNPTIEESQPAPKRSRKAGVLLLFFIIILIIAGFGYGYFQLGKVNVHLAKMVSGLEKQAINTHSDITSLQQSINDLQQAAQKSQELSTKQEQMIADWQAAQKGDLNKWYAAEAEYLVKLANDHVQFTHNISMAITLLTRADSVLANLQDPNLLEIRKALATDMASLQAVPQIDVTALYLRLTALNNQIDQLPLPMNPLKAEEKPAAPEPAGLPWWKRGLHRTWEALSRIVIVRNNGSNALPLVLPEEKTFLYQNLHAQMEGAMWGVLYRNEEVYQANLNRSISWVEHYFAQDAPLTKTVLQNLQELRNTHVQPPMVNLSNTISLFDSYFKASGQPQAAQ